MFQMANMLAVSSFVATLTSFTLMNFTEEAKHQGNPDTPSHEKTVQENREVTEGTNCGGK